MNRKLGFISIALLLLFICVPSVQSQDSPELTNIRVNRLADKLEVRIELNTTVNYESFTLFNPNRLIIDLLQVRTISAPSELNVGDYGVKRVRAAKNQPDVTRVVFDLDDAVPSYSIEDTGIAIIVTFRVEGRVETEAEPVQEKVEPETKAVTQPEEAPAQEEQRPRATADGYRGKRIGLGITGGLYLVQSKDFKDVYGSSAPSLGASLSYLHPLSDEEALGLSLDFNYIFATGQTTYTQEEVKLNFTPLGLMVFYQRHFGIIAPYAGIGVELFSYTEQYPETFAISESKGSTIGYSFMIGSHIEIIPTLSAKLYIKHHVAKKTEEEFEINLSGTELGLGFTYYFNF